MSVSGRRLAALEDVFTPKEVERIFILKGYGDEEQEAEIESLRAAGTPVKIIHLVTICGRRCPDDVATCEQPLGCRLKAKGINPSWQPPD